jgi:type I restriction enzyme, R subunit
MSMLLDEIIKFRKERADNYEEYLKRIAELAKKVEAGKADDTPMKLDTPGKRALWNNLGQNEALALKIDEAVKRVRPDDWRGNQARENQIKREGLLPLLGNEVEVERVFLIIKAQTEY